MTATTAADVPAVERPDRTSHFFPALDSVRGFAATAVLTTHVAFATGATLTGAVGAVLARLDYGVAIFFLLSGFLLVRPWLLDDAGLGRPVAVRTYLRRRMFRILPLYWVVMLVAFLAIPANRESPPSEWITNALLLQIYPGGDLPDGLTQAWSLATEMSFYLVLPALAWLLSRVATGSSGSRPWRPGRALVLLGLLAVLAWGFQLAVRWPGSPIPEQAGYWLPYHLDWFAFGMTLAVLEVAGRCGLLPRLTSAARSVAGYLGTCWSVGVLAFLLAATPLAGPRGFETVPDPWGSLAKSALYGLSAFFILLPLVMLPVGQTRGRRLLQTRPLRWLGDISYGIFLWHLLVLEAVMVVSGIPEFSGGFVPVWIATWTITVAVSWVSYRLVERPAQRRGHRVRPPAEAGTASGRTPAPSAPAAG